MKEIDTPTKVSIYSDDNSQQRSELMLNKMLKSALVFVMLVAFVFTSISITLGEGDFISLENAVKHSDKTCTKLWVDISRTCSPMDGEENFDCTKVTIDIDVIDGNCDTSDGEYDCYLYNVMKREGSAKCFVDDMGNCLYNESKISKVKHDECYNELK